MGIIRFRQLAKDSKAIDDGWGEYRSASEATARNGALIHHQ